MDKTGFIYVLTNESFHRDNWVKIGYAEDVEKRVKDLSRTAVPLPYEVYCTYEIPRIIGVKDPDKLVHDLIQAINPNLRISPNREFFELYPWAAYEMLKAIAQMHNRIDKLIRNESNQSGLDLQNDTDYSTDTLFPPHSVERLLFDRIKGLIMSVDDSLQETPRQLYVVFKNSKKNTVAVWPKDGWVEVVLNAKLGQITDDSGLMYDISNRKWTAAQYAFKFYDDTNDETAKKIIEQTINLSKK